MFHDSQQTVTFGEYMCVWLNMKRPSLAPSTEVEYERLIKNYVLSSPVGAERLNSLSCMSLMQVISVPLGLRYTRQSQILTLLIREALRDGRRFGVINHNPAEMLALPKHTRREVNIWNHEQIKAFLSSSADSPLFAVWLLALCLGLRRGELLGLRWSDIDFEHGFLHIQNQRQRIRGQIIDKAPKSAAGVRVLAAPAPVLAALRALRASQRPLSLYVCPMTPESLAKALKAAQRAAGLPEITIHALRHSMATAMIASGCNPKILQGILGHAHYQTTADFYCHRDTEAEASALKVLAESL